MTAQDLREKFLNFFAKNGHAIIPSASLVPSEELEFTGTQKVLFTTAGMHPLVPYLLGKGHPLGKRLTNVQKCLRTDDIDEVGDAIHNTFFEMLGNWSLGDYWKEDAIKWSYEFLTLILNLPTEKLAVAVFAGDSDAPFDQESFAVWRKLGIKEARIAKLGKKDNWWGPVGGSGPCGPSTEMFYWVGESSVPGTFDPSDKQWVEIWNDVFMEYNKKEAGTYEPLKQKNVDTGMGLERTLMILQGKSSVYETDIFSPLMEVIGGSSEKGDRVFVDHIKAAVMIIADGVEPSNKDRGYILRRLIRRSIVKAQEMKVEKEIIKLLVSATIKIYQETYPHLVSSQEKITHVLNDEITRFGKTLKTGLSEFAKLNSDVSGKQAFDLYQNLGFPIELTVEMAKEKGIKVDVEGFYRELEKHQQLSRTASSGMFKGGLAGHSDVEIKYHTATHLLHQALRDVLGPEVLQKGSNINQQRLRFDFSFNRKLTADEINKVEEIVNQKIKQDLSVDRKLMSVDEAKKLNALGLFEEKYADQVSIYGVGPNYKLDDGALDQRERGGYYSLEFCGGPHVERTKSIGKIKIVDEEGVGSGIRRIRASLE